MHHFFGGAYFISKKSDRFGAFRMSDNFGVRIFIFDFLDRLPGEFDVNVAGALPEIHLATCLLDNPLAKVGVGNKQDWAIFWGLIDDFRSVS